MGDIIMIRWSMMIISDDDDNSSSCCSFDSDVDNHNDNMCVMTILNE